MVPYFLLLFISAVFPLIIYRNRGNYSCVIQKRSKMTISLFFGGLFVLLALRHIEVGTDLKEYKEIFGYCYRASIKELPNLRWELGYTIYNKVVTIISKEYRFFLVVTAFIILMPIYKLYIKEKKYSLLLIVIFINMPCFLMMFSGLRQAIATSIGVLVFMAIENKKYILSVLLIILAASFHVSAYVLFLIYPVFFWKIKTKHLLYILPIILAIYVFRVPILNTLISFAPSHYIEFYGEIQQTGAIGMMILFLIFSVFSFVVLNEKIMSNRDFFLRNILLISTVFQFFVPIHGLVQRMSYYFMIFVPVAIVSIVQAPKRMWKSISNTAVVVMVCFFSLYFFYTALFSTDNMLDVFPYKFLWSN